MRPILLAVLLATSVSAQPRITDASRPTATLADTPFGQVPAVIDAQLRVRPDRRFLIAAVDAHELLAGGKSAVASIDFADGRWQLTVDGNIAGSLAEVPAFAEALELVTRIASAHPKRNNAAADAHALTVLNVQTPDRAGVADALRARGLAFLGIAHAADRTCCSDHVAMLAELFGYETEARAFADKLPETSAGRAYVRRTSASGSDAFAQWVTRRSRILGAQQDAQRTKMFESEAKSVEALAQLLANPSEATRPKLARAVAFATAEEMAGRTVSAADALNATQPLDAIVRDFDGNVIARARATATPLVPEELLTAMFAARFLSALHDEFDAVFSWGNDAEKARALTRELAGATLPQLRQFGEWMQVLTKLKWERGAGVSLSDALARVPLLGGYTRSEILIEGTRAFEAHSVAQRLALWSLYPELDTRPLESYRAGSLAHSILTDPMRRDRDFGSAIERAPRFRGGSDRARFYERTGNLAKLKEVALSADANPDDRARALQALSARDDADDAFVRTRFEGLIAQTTDSWAYSRYASYLNTRGDWKTKERMARNLLARLREGDSDRAYFAGSLAHALERQGRYDEAWTVLEPYLPTGESLVYANAMSLLERRGHKEEALELGRKMIERYPQGSRRADFAMVLCRMGRCADGAEVLDPKHRYAFSPLATYFPEVFLETFSNAPVAETVAAFREFAKVNFEPTTLSDVARAFAKRGQRETATALATAFADEQPTRLHVQIDAWKQLRDGKGIPAASEWLRTRVDESRHSTLASIAHTQQADDLIWHFLDATKAPDAMPYILLAAVKQRVPRDDPRWKTLVEVVRGLGESAETAPFRYLAGLADERSLDALGADDRTRALIPYVIGVRSAADGDYDKALPWLLAATFGADRSLPSRGAIALLQTWTDSNTSWTDIKRKRPL
jgi:tetratricopeptide (TPR) repeat protein